MYASTSRCRRSDSCTGWAGQGASCKALVGRFSSGGRSRAWAGLVGHFSSGGGAWATGQRESLATVRMGVPQVHSKSINRIRHILHRFTCPDILFRRSHRWIRVGQSFGEVVLGELGGHSVLAISRPVCSDGTATGWTDRNAGVPTQAGAAAKRRRWELPGQRVVDRALCQCACTCSATTHPAHTAASRAVHPGRASSLRWSARLRHRTTSWSS